MNIYASLKKNIITLSCTENANELITDISSKIELEIRWNMTKISKF